MYYMHIPKRLTLSRHTETHRQMDTPYGTYHLARLLRDAPRIDLARYTRLRVRTRRAVFEVRPSSRGCANGWHRRVLASPERGRCPCEREGREGEGDQWGCGWMCEGLGGGLALIGSQGKQGPRVDIMVGSMICTMQSSRSYVVVGCKHA